MESRTFWIKPSFQFSSVEIAVSSATVKPIANGCWQSVCNLKQATYSRVRLGIFVADMNVFYRNLQIINNFGDQLLSEGSVLLQIVWNMNDDKRKFYDAKIRWLQSYLQMPIAVDVTVPNFPIAHAWYEVNVLHLSLHRTTKINFIWKMEIKWVISKRFGIQQLKHKFECTGSSTVSLKEGEARRKTSLIRIRTGFCFNCCHGMTSVSSPR